jgi:hypothetical protein
MSMVVRFLSTTARRDQFLTDSDRIERIIANLSYKGSIVAILKVQEGLDALHSDSDPFVVPRSENINRAASMARHVSSLQAAERVGNIHDVETPLNIKESNDRFYRC